MHPVVSQRGMGGEGETAGENEAAVSAVLDRGGQQRVFGVTLSDRAWVPGDCCRSLQPVALALEGIGGKEDAPCARAVEVGLPLDLGPGGMGSGDRGVGSSGLRAPLAQRRQEGGPLLLGAQALARHRAKGGLWAELQISARSLLCQGGDRIG